MDLLDAMRRATPIGLVPDDYPHMADLCRRAHIAYEDETIRYKDQPRQYRRWFVTYDDHKHPRKHRTVSGRLKLDHTHLIEGTVDHERFCMILDYIIARGEHYIRNNGIRASLDRTGVLNVAAGVEAHLTMPDGTKLELGTKVARMFSLPLGLIVDDLRATGVRKYDRAGSSEEQKSEADTVDVVADLEGKHPTYGKKQQDAELPF